MELIGVNHYFTLWNKDIFILTKVSAKSCCQKPEKCFPLLIQIGIVLLVVEFLVHPVLVSAFSFVFAIL